MWKVFYTDSKQPLAKMLSSLFNLNAHLSFKVFVIFLCNLLIDYGSCAQAS